MQNWRIFIAKFYPFNSFRFQKKSKSITTGTYCAVFYIYLLFIYCGILSFLLIMENTQIENLNTANITDWQRWHLSQINKDDHLSNELHEAFETTLFHILMDRHNKMALKVIALEKQVATLQNMPIKDENIIKDMNALQKERNDLFAKNSDLKRKNERLQNERNDYFFQYVSTQHTLKSLQKSYDNLKQLLQNLI